MTCRTSNSIGRTILAACFLCVAQIPIARSDPAFCLSRASSYVRELDELLAKEESWLTPFMELNKLYFPVVDCDQDPFLEEFSRSRYLRSIVYFPRTKEYVVRISSKEVSVSFEYSVK